MDEDLGRRDREERSDRSDVGITAAAPVPGTALERAQASTLRSRQRRSRGMRLGDWERVHCRLRRLAWRSWLFPWKRHWQGMAAESRGADEPSPRRGACLSQALYHDGTAYSQTDCSSTLLWSSPQLLDPFSIRHTHVRESNHPAIAQINVSFGVLGRPVFPSSIMHRKIRYRSSVSEEISCSVQMDVYEQPG